eukprot:2315313-Alexandrium_andersonii.AAC.1
MALAQEVGHVARSPAMWPEDELLSSRALFEHGWPHGPGLALCRCRLEPTANFGKFSHVVAT